MYRVHLKIWTHFAFHTLLHRGLFYERPTRITNCANSTAPMHSINNTDEGMTQMAPLIPDIPFYPGPTYRPPPKLIRSQVPGSHQGSQSSDSSGSTNINTDINLDFEENSPFQDVVIWEAYQRPNKSIFQEPQELNSLVNTSNLVKIFPAKTSQHRQNTKGDTKKSP